MREQAAPQSLSQGDTPYLPPRGPGEPCCLWGASGPGSGPLAPPSQPHSITSLAGTGSTPWGQGSSRSRPGLLPAAPSTPRRLCTRDQPGKVNQSGCTLLPSVLTETAREAAARGAAKGRALPSVSPSAEWVALLAVHSSALSGCGLSASAGTLTSSGLSLNLTRARDCCRRAKGERDLCTQFGGWPPAILRRRWGHRTSRHCLERGQALRPQLFLPWLSGCVSVRILLRLQGARCF